MNFSLSSYTYLVAENDMQCDAFKIWCDTVSGLDCKEKQKGVEVWFNARHGIVKGSQYLEYKFNVVDEETGELIEQVLSCRIDMNKLMVKHNWYPKIIQQAFKKYKA